MNKDNQLQVQILADKPVISKDKSAERILEITITAQGNQITQPRVPLNLSLVLDRSGSMQGEKLHYVKQAASHVIDLLEEQDRLAIVIYDDKVDTLLSSSHVTDNVKKVAKDKLNQVEARASTFLYGGWLQGCREIAEHGDDKTFNRTLLLTDGLANVGERNINALANHARELFMRGISTSCFGAGIGYDEHLLEAMANHGGGNFHFLETLNAIPHVFEREFDELISIALRDVSIKLELPESIQGKVSAGYHYTREDSSLTIHLGSLTANHQRSVYVKLSNLTEQDHTDLNIPVKVFGKDLNQSVVEAISNFNFKIIDTKEEAAYKQDAELIQRFALVDIADKANEALKLERSGNREGSHRLMTDSLSMHKKHINQSTFDRYETFSSSLSVGLDEVNRKRHHRQEYENKRGWQSIRDYRLSLDHGALISNIEGRSVLINTMGLVSIGTHQPFIFLNTPYNLPLNDGQKSCELLSKLYGTRIDAMLGMDILKDLYINVIGNRKVIQFSRQHLPLRGNPKPLENRGGRPYINFKVNGKLYDLFLSTTQRFSYIDKSVIENQISIGKEKDIFPDHGEISTTLYECDGNFDHQRTALKFGGKTDVIQQHYQFTKQDGILGTEMFQKFSVNLAFPDNRIIFMF